MQPSLVKKRELSRIISTSPRTIDAWIAKRLIPYIAVSPRLHLFNVQEVLDALAKRFSVKTQEDR